MSLDVKIITFQEDACKSFEILFEEIIRQLLNIQRITKIISHELIMVTKVYAIMVY